MIDIRTPVDRPDRVPLIVEARVMEPTEPEGLPEPDPDEAVGLIADGLAGEFPGVDGPTITAVVREVYDELREQSKIPAFVGVLAERLARDRIAALGSDGVDGAPD